MVPLKVRHTHPCHTSVHSIQGDTCSCRWHGDKFWDVTRVLSLSRHVTHSPHTVGTLLTRTLLGAVESERASGADWQDTVTQCHTLSSTRWQAWWHRWQVTVTYPLGTCLPCSRPDSAQRSLRLPDHTWSLSPSPSLSLPLSLPLSLSLSLSLSLLPRASLTRALLHARRSIQPRRTGFPARRPIEARATVALARLRGVR